MMAEAEKPPERTGYKETKWRDATVFRCTARGCDYDHEYEDAIKAHVALVHPKRAEIAKESP